MQLFHTSQYTIQSNTITISDPRVISQLTRVLRAKLGQTIFVQSIQNDNVMRYECEMISIAAKEIQATITNTQMFDNPIIHKHLIIAMSNKRDKMELIVQKATECGMNHISIIPMQRSVIRHCTANKRSRIQSIMLEATEQSRRSHLPLLQWCANRSDLTLSGQTFIADMDGVAVSELSKQSDIAMIIGPEGGLDPKDYTAINKHFPNTQSTTISLGSTVLRMETAAIVGSRWMCL